MRNARVRRHVFIHAVGLQIRHLAPALVQRNVTVLYDGHARTVVAAIFQALQSVNQYGIRFLLPDVCHYSTHILRFFKNLLQIYVKILCFPKLFLPL
jgi:hypothetical protein